MSLVKLLFGSRSEPTASKAKERLQLIIAHESNGRTPDFLPKLLAEIKEVVSRYMSVTEESVNLNIERRGNTDVLEMNLVLEEKTPGQSKS